MPRVEKSVLLHAPIDQVFSLIADEPERMSIWWPPIESHKRISPPPTQIDSVSRYVYNILGLRIKGDYQVQTFSRNERFVIHSISGVDSLFDFRFEVYDQRVTHVTVVVEYQLPGAIIGQLLKRSEIEAENVNNLENGLKNLRRLLEVAYVR